LKALDYVPKNDSIVLLLGTNPDAAATSIIEMNTRSYSHTVVELPTQGEQSILSARVDPASQFLHLMVLEHERGHAGGEIIEYEQIGPSRFIERSVDLQLKLPIIAAATCDCNRDGYTDIVSLVYQKQGGKRLIYESLGDSGESFGRPHLAAALDSVEEVSALVWSADLNTDGQPDLIVEFEAPVNELLVMLGRRDSAFSPAAALPSRVSISGAGNLKVFDVNGDGVPDMVVQNDLTRSIETYLGQGDGSFIAGFHLISTRDLGGFTVTEVAHNRSSQTPQVPQSPELIVTDAQWGVLQILPLGDDR
jgi:hypothetical protein